MKYDCSNGEFLFLLSYVSRTPLMTLKKTKQKKECVSVFLQTVCNTTIHPEWVKLLWLISWDFPVCPPSRSLDGTSVSPPPFHPHWWCQLVTACHWWDVPHWIHNYTLSSLPEPAKTKTQQPSESEAPVSPSSRCNKTVFPELPRWLLQLPRLFAPRESTGKKTLQKLLRDQPQRSYSWCAGETSNQPKKIPQQLRREKSL